MCKVVLIHTQSEDDHATEVQRCLSSLGVPSAVLVRERCFQDWTISCAGDDVLVDAGSLGKWNADSIVSVLWRRNYNVEPSWVQPGLDSGVAFFVANQRAYHVRSSFQSLSHRVPFVNRLHVNEVSSSKHLQQRIARGCGLRVPLTYIGSDAATALRFAETLWSSGRRCCTKNLETIPVDIAGTTHARLTQLFQRSDVEKLQSLAACPMIFQEYVEKRYEYRVTVVGEEVYSCRIDSQAAGGRTATDWRHYNIPATPHYKANLPARVDDGLVKLVAALGLTYAAIDIAESLDGDFFFLELNSMGQWLWIELLTDLPISMAIARQLADPRLVRR